MRYIPDILLALGWNKRHLTFEDFERCCEQLGVHILFTDTGDEGAYLIRRGHPFIILSKKLHGMMLLWVAWHELSHHLLHHPGMQNFVRGTENKLNAEANLIAACAIIPETSLIKILEYDFFEEHLYPKKLLQIRLEANYLRGL